MVKKIRRYDYYSNDDELFEKYCDFCESQNGCDNCDFNDEKSCFNTFIFSTIEICDE